MPTSGDLKSGDCLFFTTPLRNFNEPPPPLEKLTHWHHLDYIIQLFLGLLIYKVN